MKFAILIWLPRVNIVKMVEGKYKYEKYDTLVAVKDKLEERVQSLQLKNEMMQIDFNPVNAF